MAEQLQGQYGRVLAWDKGYRSLKEQLAAAAAMVRAPLKDSQLRDLWMRAADTGCLAALEGGTDVMKGHRDGLRHAVANLLVGHEPTDGLDLGGPREGIAAPSSAAAQMQQILLQIKEQQQQILPRVNRGNKAVFLVCQEHLLGVGGQPALGVVSAGSILSSGEMEQWRRRRKLLLVVLWLGACIPGGWQTAACIVDAVLQFAGVDAFGEFQDGLSSVLPKDVAQKLPVAAKLEAAVQTAPKHALEVKKAVAQFLYEVHLEKSTSGSSGGSSSSSRAALGRPGVGVAVNLCSVLLCAAATAQVVLSEDQCKLVLQAELVKVHSSNVCLQLWSSKVSKAAEVAGRCLGPGWWWAV